MSAVSGNSVPNPRVLPRYSKIPSSQYKRLPPKPSLEHLKSQAKALFKAYVRGERDALRRVRRFLPQASPQESGIENSQPRFRLKDAQYVLAREYACGWKFSSWDDLKSHIEALNNCSDAFIREQIDRLADWRERPGAFNAERFVGALGMRLLPFLHPAIRSHPSPRVRRICLECLDHLDFPVDEAFIETVITAMKDPVPKVRRVALHTLCCERCKSAPAQLKPEHVEPEHVEVMVSLSVTDENAKVRSAAEGMVRALAQKHGGRIRELLAEYARSSSDVLRQRAAGVAAGIA
jgi:hypothetical protein